MKLYSDLTVSQYALRYATVYDYACWFLEHENPKDEMNMYFHKLIVTYNDICESEGEGLLRPNRDEMMKELMTLRSEVEILIDRLR